MYKEGFATAVLVDGRVVREENGISRIPFGTEYTVRLKNKYPEPVAADVFIDGKLVNEAGHLFVPGNGTVDLDRWIFKDKTDRKLQFVKLTEGGKGVEANEQENGVIEVRFYKPKKADQLSRIISEIHIHEWPWYPVWIMPRVVWYDDTQVYPMKYERTITNNNGWSGYYETFSGASSDGSIRMSSVSSSASYSASMAPASQGKDGKLSLNYHIPNPFLQALASQPGATAEGKKVDDKSEALAKKAEFKLEFEPIVLTMKLMGFDGPKPEAKNYCETCGRKRRDRENFCPSCGSKY